MSVALARHDTKAGTIMTPISAAPSHPRSITPADVALGERIRSMRNERSLSMKGMGDLLGVSWQQFQKYELGRNKIGAARLQRIAAILECPLSALLGDTAQQAEQSLGDRMTSSRRGCRAATAFTQLDGDAQDFVVNLAEWLLQVQEKRT